MPQDTSPERRPRRKWLARHLELQRQIDRYSIVAAKMKRGSDPPADLVLEELGGLRRIIVDQLRELSETIRSKASRAIIKDKVGLFEPMLGQLDRCRDNAPNVMTYILERWPILDELLDKLLRAYVPIADHYRLWIWRENRPVLGKTPQFNTAALATFDGVLDELETYVDLFYEIIERYGVATTDAPERALTGSERRILAHCRRKAHKGERIAVHLGLSFDHTRRLLARLVREGRLRKTEDGYRTIPRAT